MGEESKQLTITLSETEWTYISFQKGEVVGHSLFNDQQADEEWFHKENWDFAICGELIKTNSGSSGNGDGGIQQIRNATFEPIESYDSSKFRTDTNL